jgi:hypothetical protein
MRWSGGLYIETEPRVPPNEIRIHVAGSRHIILVERGWSAPRQLLYIEFQVGVMSGSDCPKW